MEAGAVEQDVVVEVVAGVMQRPAVGAVSEEGEAARHMFEEAGEILRRRVGAGERRHPVRAVEVARHGERLVGASPVVEQRYEFPRVTHLGGDVVGQRRALGDDAHLPLDDGADLRVEGAHVAPDAGLAGQHVAGAVGYQFGHREHGGLGRVEPARHDGLQAGDQRAGRDERLAAGLRARGMAAQPAQHDLEIVLRRHQRAGAKPESAGR